MQAKKIFSCVIALLTLVGCTSNTKPKEVCKELEEKLKYYDESYSNSTFNIEKIDCMNDKKDFIHSIDSSFLYAIEKDGKTYKDFDMKERDYFDILKDNNVNAIRLRLYHDYTSPSGQLRNGDLSLDNVISMGKRAKKKGMKIILSLQYSDTWADPDSQDCPYAWKDKTYDEAKTLLYEYTKEVVSSFKKNKAEIDYIQIGNEINSGMCYPYGEINWDNENTINEGFDRFVGLLKEGIRAVKEITPNAKTIIHTSNSLRMNEYTSNPENAFWFYQKLADRNLEYDIIGSSFYYIYDKTPISKVTPFINAIVEKFNKDFFLMEYSYGYTLRYGDDTPNILYTTNKDPDYPLTISGQASYMRDIIQAVASSNRTLGTSYWGGEWIVNNSIDYNNWENQALFTFDGYALPSLKVFKEIY